MFHKVFPGFIDLVDFYCLLQQKPKRNLMKLFYFSPHRQCVMHLVGGSWSTITDIFFSFLKLCLLSSRRASFPFLDFPCEPSPGTLTPHIHHTCLRSAVSQCKLPGLKLRHGNTVYSTEHHSLRPFFHPGLMMDSKVFICASAAELQKWMQHIENRRHKSMEEPMSPSQCALSYLVMTYCCTSGYNCTWKSSLVKL